MKKIISFCLVPMAVFALSCGEKKYSEFRAYPLPEKQILNPGDSSFITIRTEIPYNAHIYGNPKGPGIGKATSLSASGPKIFAFGEARYPRAEKYIYPGEKDHVWIHQGMTDFYLPLEVSSQAKEGRYDVTIRLEALLCTETTCTPRTFSFKYPISISADIGSKTIIAHELAEGFSNTGTHSAVDDKAIATGSGEETDSYFTDITLTPRCIEETNITGLIQAVLFGLLAGIILNIMPCVLPVVSLKIMSFVQHAGNNRRQLFALGLLFSLGILTSFSILAGLAAFFGYSWGELFQHQLFLVGMAALVFALGLSLFDVFTLNIPSFAGRAAARDRKNKYSDAFVKGLLATLLATPCSGPFLGGTLAWALAQPPHIIFTIFMSIGIGMALPYLLLTANPAMVRFIPKPGPWLKTFEQLMAFLLMFTVIYLISIMGAETRLSAIAFLGFVALGFWQYGVWGSPLRSGIQQIISAGALIVIMLGGYSISFHYFFTTTGSLPLTGNAFSEKRILENKDRGTISLIKFTADWCPNCTLVEKVSLETAEVKKVISENNIDFITADITRDNPAAEKLLMMLGSRSIPALAVMPPGDNFTRPICLRDLYSKDDVLKAIDTVLDETTEGKTPEIPFHNAAPLFEIKTE